MNDPKKKHNEQGWELAKSKRFDNYAEARAAFDIRRAKVERIRVRRRAGGFYDVVEYKRVAKKESK